jgi:hypothetical protein
MCPTHMTTGATVVGIGVQVSTGAIAAGLVRPTRVATHITVACCTQIGTGTVATATTIALFVMATDVAILLALPMPLRPSRPPRAVAARALRA